MDIEKQLNTAVVNEALAENKAYKLEKELKKANDRINRLEKAGDKMHNWLMSKNRIGCDMEIASEWTRAKKNKP
jgi:hypothetical protein